MKPLKGGIKLDGKKDATLIPWTALRPDPPRRVRVPLPKVPGSERHTYEKVEPGTFGSGTFRVLVRTGDRVRTGEKIAEGPGEEGVGLHASISGRVAQANGFIEILSDGKDEMLPGIGHERPGWDSLPEAELERILRESGIKLPQPSSVHTLILNGCESEPYLTSDHSLMMSHPVEVLRGGEILKRALQAEELVIALEDNKEEVAELLKSKIFFHPWSHARVEVFPTRYPQEDGRLLVRRLGVKIEETAVFNVALAYAAYEAVVLQKPFYERIVTIGGECVAQPRNFWLRIGTSVEDAVKYARGFLRAPEKVLLGGPMKGRAIESLEAPIEKGTRAVLGLPPELTRPEAVEPCIRCGRCLESCPVSISPAMITLAAEKDLFALAADYGAPLCIECGNCSYVCPAKRPMVELIQYANAH